MAHKNIIVEVNSNYHRVVGEDLLINKDVRFSEYRKKWKEWPVQFYEVSLYY